MQYSVMDSAHVNDRPAGVTPKITHVTSIVKRSFFRNAAEYFLYGTTGLYCGSAIGNFIGISLANRTLTRDLDSKRRIGDALTRLKADILREDSDAFRDGKTVKNWRRDGAVHLLGWIVR